MNTLPSILPAKSAKLVLAPGQSIEQSLVLTALRSHRINAVAEAQVLAFVSTGFNKAALLLNHQKSVADEETNKMACHEIVFALVDRYGHLTLDEIPIVFRKGALGDFRKDGDVLFLSVSNVVGWFKAYRAGLRAESLRSVGETQLHPLLHQADGPCCHFPDNHPLWIFSTAARLLALVEKLLLPGEVYNRNAFDRPLYDFCKTMGLLGLHFEGGYYVEVLNEEAKRIYDAGNPSAGGMASSWDEKGAWKTFSSGYEQEEMPVGNRHTQRVMQNCRERLLREYLTESAAGDDSYRVTVRAAVGRYLRENPFVPPVGVELP